MRAYIEAVLLRLWYTKKDSGLIVTFLKPLSHLFKKIASDRFHSQRNQLGITARNYSATIVIIGNITVGGTGKTPLLIAIATRLMNKGYRVGILSRGYGGDYLKEGGAPREVFLDDSWQDVGDEPLLILNQLKTASRPAALQQTSNPRQPVPLVVSKQRLSGLDFLCKQHELDVVLSDDGLQHYRLPRDLEFVVIDADRGFGNRQLLPAGPLREPLERLTHADHLFVNGEPDVDLAEQLIKTKVPFLSISMVNQNIRPLNKQAQAQLESLSASDILDLNNLSLETVFGLFNEIHAIAGIGNPEKFFENIERRIKTVESGETTDTIRSLYRHTFPDHHAYSQSDIDRLLSMVKVNNLSALFMTEKDAIKAESLVAVITMPAFAIGLDALIDDSVILPIVQRIEKIRCA